MKNEKLILKVVVNGDDVEIEANPNAELRTVVTKALAETKNAGQPFDNWVLRDAAGNGLDLSAKVGVLMHGATLYLNPRAGIGG